MTSNRIEPLAGREAPGLIALNLFCAQMGIHPITAWRWRKQGWLPTVNIAGRVYLTAEGIAQFKRRAAAGEFAKQHKAPSRKPEEK